MSKKGYREKIYLDKNESPFDLPLEIKEKILEILRKTEFNRYPQETSISLREKIGEFWGLDAKNVTVGNGSDELIGYLMRALKGKYVVVTPPTFSMYYFYAEVNGLPVKEVPLDRDFVLRGEKIVEEAKDARVVFITSPNNPTGNSQPRDEIKKVLDSGVIVVLDEAYADFSGKNMVDSLSDYENLIILRTFSKAFGLAGVRLGYILANENIIRDIYRIIPPFPVSTITMVIGSFALENYGVFERRIRYIIRERNRMYRELKSWAYPSEANFLLLNVNAYHYLLERDVIVRDVGDVLKGHIRVTVGRKEENDILLLYLKEFLEERE